MNLEEIISLINKAVSEHGHTKSLHIQVVPAENDTIKVLGRVQTFFQKCMLITVVRSVCPDKALSLSDVVVTKSVE